TVVFCATYPILRRTSPAAVATLSPATRTRPAVGTESVARILTVVDLPAPFGPRSPKISPVSTVKDTPLTASTGPGYVLRRTSTTLTGIFPPSIRSPRQPRRAPRTSSHRGRGCSADGRRSPVPSAPRVPGRVPGSDRFRLRAH